MECYSCKSISGERKISPGPTIYDGKYWYIDHAYPCALKGWLVLVLKRHEEFLHNLTKEEFIEMAELQQKTVKLLKQELKCEKEYLMCIAEAEHFKHIHVHVIPKPENLPEEFKGPKIFAMLKPDMKEPVSAEEIKFFCEQLKEKFIF